MTAPSYPAPPGTAEESPVIAAARDRLARAQAALEAASEADADAAEAEANAAGAVEVARAKLADYEDDATTPRWKLVAAGEAVAKAERALGRRHAQVQHHQQRLEAAALEHAAAEAELARCLVEPAPAAVEPRLQFGSVNEFFRDYLRHMYKRRIDTGKGHVWSARWWDYPEALARLEALWRAWEHLRLDPATGMSVWFRDHADHHMAILMSAENGPFGDQGRHRTDMVTDPLPHEEPPPGMFIDER